MSDFIKREDAISTMYEFLKQANDISGRNNEKLAEIQVIAKNVIYTIPSADVAPVRHGHWVEMSYDEYKCSVCEKVVREEILYAIKPSDREDASMHIANYCPNCGARMDAKE